MKEDNKSQNKQELNKRQLLHDLLVIAKKGLDSLIYDKISYDKIMKFFIDHNNNPKIAKGALLRETQGDKYILYQVFLDTENNIICEKNNVPLGRKLSVKQLDNELNNLFGSDDMVIVE